MAPARTIPINRHLLAGVAMIALSLAALPPASAQNAALEPTFGIDGLEPGFGASTITIQAGGDIDAGAAGDGCNGFIADAPDYAVDYQGTAPLEIRATSAQDTTLRVVTPSGALLCNDDYQGLNPGLQTGGGEQGRFLIWVGTFDPIVNNTFPDADIAITERGGAVAPPATPSRPATSGFDAGLPPTFGEIAVTRGFGSQTFDLQAGGTIEAFSVNDACAGFVADVPDYLINLQDNAAGTLDLSVVSVEDTTLVVVAPDGSVYCNDDAVDLNPALSITGPIPGFYALWVGTFGAIQNDFFPDAQLTVATSGSGTARPATPATPARPTSPATGGLAERLRLQPAFGAVQLGAGFGSHAIDIQAGGFLDASALDGACFGNIAEAPDYVVTYSGSMALRITATSDEDTTMAVATPDGQVLCNDDFSGLNPGLIAPENLPGQYAIWIGTYTPIANDVYPAASLQVEEISTFKAHPSGAINSISLTAGFTPDPFTTVLAAGGVLNASSIDGGCYGNIAATPDFVLNYTAGEWPLRVFVNSDADTTLLMRTPTGEVLCNDDADGLNPGLSLTAPVSGRYEIFIGTYDPSAGFPEATLAISELLDEKVLPEGALTDTTVSAGSPRQDFELLAGGSFEAFSTFGANCNGFVAGNPDFIAYVDGNGIDVEMTVRSAEDTTLVVRGPDGAVFCDDDSAGDLNPLVIVGGAQAGAYEVWLGTFSSVGTAPATLSVRDLNAIGNTPPNVPGGGKK